MDYCINEPFLTESITRLRFIKGRHTEATPLGVVNYTIPGKEDLDKLYYLKNYIDANFLSDLSLLKLCRICCLNEFKVKKGFKTLFGDTVFGYIRQLRMEYAGKVLRNTSCTVDEVADMLGYEHAHHFSKAFKDFAGYSPSVYRKID